MLLRWRRAGPTPGLWSRNQRNRKGSSSTLLHVLPSNVDKDALSQILHSEDAMDEAKTEEAFWAVVNEVDRAEAHDEPLSPDVPRMLHKIFDADLQHLLTREQIRTNLTCMQPALTGRERRQLHGLASWTTTPIKICVEGRSRVRGRDVLRGLLAQHLPVVHATRWKASGRSARVSSGSPLTKSRACRRPLFYSSFD